MGSGSHIGWMSAPPWIHLLPYLFLWSVETAHLDCTYNSWTLLSCSWDADSNFTSSPCYISANVIDEKRDIKGFCFLTPNGNPRSCAINLTTDGKPVKDILTIDHKLNMSVICSNGLKRNTSVTFLSDFSAYHNLLLDPPVSTDIKMISYGVWKLTWDITHGSNIENIETEIYYKPVNQLWQDAQNVKVKNVNLVILNNLRPDTQYEAKVRMNQTNFPSGRWSDWGKPVQWTTTPEVHLDCTHNSFETVSCSWDVARNLTSTPCYLLAYVINDARCIKGICYLPASSDIRSCVINLTVNGEYCRNAITAVHHLNVSVICSVGKNTNKTVISSHFHPFSSLRLDPPMFLDIRMLDDGTWNLTWVIDHGSYIEDVETEVLFKPVKWSWKEAKRFTIKQYDLSVLLRDLHPDTLYEAKVRVNQRTFPGGRCSVWSKPVQWTTPPKVHLDCTHNSFETVSCSWEVARNLTSTPCYLLAYVINDARRIKGICYLPPSSDIRSCVMNLTVKGEHYRNAMTAVHLLNVSVICSVGKNTNNTVTSSHFHPFFSLRLDPPMFLDIRMLDDGTWNLTWVNDHRNYIEDVETEVFFKPVKWSWKEAKRFTIKQYDLSVLLRDLHPDTLYEAKVRINQTNFSGGRWSEWSKPVQWTTPPKGSTFTTPGVVTISVVLLIVVVTLCSSKRVKKLMWIGVPDPSQFFHPLIDTHKGNFKKWLSTPYVFSPFFLDPNPLDISPLNINCKVEEQHLKSPPTSKAEGDKDKTGHSGSSFTNKEYFSSVYLGYDHFPTTVVNESLHSPTDEHMPLFQAEYLCAPQSFAGFGVHNGSFERDAPHRVIQMPVLVEEIIAKLECDDEKGDISSHQETENVREEERKDSSEDQKESLDTSSTTSLTQKHDSKPLKEANVAADYLSLKELYQKHCQWV